MRPLTTLAISAILILSIGLAASLMMKTLYEEDDLKQKPLTYNLSAEFEPADFDAKSTRFRHVVYTRDNVRLGAVLYIYRNSTAANRKWVESHSTVDGEKLDGKEVSVSSGKADLLHSNAYGCLWTHKNAVLHITDESYEDLPKEKMLSLCEKIPAFMNNKPLLLEKWA